MRHPYGFGICGGVFVFRLLRLRKDIRDTTSLRLLPSQKDVQDNVAALGARCVIVVKKIQSERMYFRKMTGMGGVGLVEMAELVLYGGYAVLERMRFE